MSESGKVHHNQTIALIALALLAGVCSIQMLADLNSPVLSAGVLPQLLLIFSLLLFYYLPSRRFLIAFFIGALWALVVAQGYLKHQLPQQLIGQDILIRGQVSGLVDYSSKSVRFNFEVNEFDSIKGKRINISPSTLPKRLRLSWYYHQGKVHSGEQWQLTVRLKPPHGMQNPGGFDYEKWLYQQGVHATGYIRKNQLNRRIGTVSSGVDTVREQLLSSLSQLPNNTYQGLLQALTIGHKSAITQDQWQVLRRTGTSHLMAISGLHVGMVAGLVFVVVRRLLPTFILKHISAPQIAALFSLLVAGFYTLLAGFSVPTQRAFAMLLVFMLAIVIKRRAFSINTLALALIAVLAINPVSVLSVGFWLSFLAVLIITLVSSARVVGGQTKVRLWLQGLRVQWLIALGMLPLSILLFQQGSLISPLANMLVIPLIGMLIVPLSLLASLLSAFSVEAGIYLFSMISEVFSWVWALLEWLSYLPAASWQRSSIAIVPAIISVSGAVLLLMPRGFPLRYSGIILLLPLLLYSYPKPEQGEFSVQVLDVGQGLSIVIQTRDNTLLYDTGSRFSDDFDMGQRVIVPYLNYIGVSTLNRLIISHGDNDHAGGAGSILQLMDVQMLFSEPQVFEERFQNEKNSQICKAGKNWQWNGVNFAFLHPDFDIPATPYKESNNRSCVLKVWNDRYSLLIPGDIERKAELQLLESKAGLLHADVLLVPHHGSNTSSTLAWLKQVKPQLGIVSAGYKNRFGHPTAKVLNRYHEQKIKVLNTAESGMILLNFPAGTTKRPLEARQQRKVSTHYWNHRL